MSNILTIISQYFEFFHYYYWFDDSGERAQNESEEEKITREAMLDENSRPKGQKKIQDNNDTSGI